jgi:GMP reductase
MDINLELKYSDVVLLPNHSVLGSRADADVTFRLGGRAFSLPIIPSNMKSVINEKKAHWLSENGYFYTMHRFGICPLEFCENSRDWKFTSISVGVNDEDMDKVALLSAQACKVDYITVDIAHGHSVLMKKMIKHIKKFLPQTFVIAGNVATKEAVNDLAKWGVDCVKVGIGQGYVCTTKDKTGFTRPMFSSILDCSKDSSVPIIADGGIKSNGDIAKAFVAGASAVMAGSIFSQCTDSPTVSVVNDGRVYKQYFGSASEYNKKEKKHIEGVMKEMPSNNMSYEEKLIEMKQDLQSAVSYSGGNDLTCFNNVEWKRVTSNL